MVGLYCIDSQKTCHQRLQSCFDEISKPSLTGRLDLIINDIRFTPSILALLIQVLNQPLCKVGAGTATDTKWDKVVLRHCSFAAPRTTPLKADDEGFCSADDIQILASSLVNRTWNLCLRHCYEIPLLVFNAPHPMLKGLFLHDLLLSTLDFAKFAGWLQRCVSLIDLELWHVRLEEPRLLLAEAFPHSFNLECIRLRPGKYGHHQEALSDLLLTRDGGIGTIVSLLRHPQSRLQRITLTDMHLEDCHFLSIIEMLPTSQLQDLDLCCNKIGRDGIMAFASQLPRIKCLKSVDIHLNYWDNSEQRATERYKECIAALARGMTENHSLEGFLPHDQLLDFFLRVNRTRRRILAVAHSIPVGLWPSILKEVGPSKWNRRRHEDWRMIRCSVLYFLLRNYPILLMATNPCCIAQAGP
jgi:hypothetical protein